MYLFAALSLLIGLSLGALPFWSWRLLLPLLISSKSPKTNFSRVILVFIMLFKFLILGLLIYGVTRLTWLNIPYFVAGLIIAPMGITGIVLTLNLARNK